ncbi:MAG: hypothetical protein AAFX94_18795 [Myxococcota bacterium]
MKSRVFWLLFLVGCGGAPAVELQANVSVQGLMQSEVSTLDAIVLGPRLNDDTILTCLSLLSGQVNPRGGSVESLASAVTNVTQGQAVELVLGPIEEGEDRLLFIEALGVSQQVVGRGCAQSINIEADATTVVDIVISDP